MRKGEVIFFRTGTERYYKCVYKFEQRCSKGEVILTLPILAAFLSPRLWIPEVRETMTGQLRKNYEKWHEWLSKHARIAMWQVEAYIRMVKEELETTWVRTKHDRSKVIKIFEDRIKAIALFLESIRREEAKAVLLPSVFQLEILRSSAYTRNQSLHVFYRSFIEEKNFEGIYSYEPSGIKGLDLVMAEHIFDYVTHNYDLFGKRKDDISFTEVKAADMDMTVAYDLSYRTAKNAYSKLVESIRELDAFEGYSFPDFTWWVEDVRQGAEKAAQQPRRERHTGSLIKFGIFRGKPGILVDGLEIPLEERIFARLLYLAFRRILYEKGKAKDPLVEKSELVFGRGEHDLLDMRKVFRSIGLDAAEILKSVRVGKIYLKGFKEVVIDSSVSQFVSEHANFIRSFLIQLKNWKTQNITKKGNWYLAELLDDLGLEEQKFRSTMKSGIVNTILVKKVLDGIGFDYRDNTWLQHFEDIRQGLLVFIKDFRLTRGEIEHYGLNLLSRTKS